ncbi:MAG: endonuclease/exonuclease/phosphatase family protein [Planctomycetes bacterium]|nr:endonuclease/exonuclease/phosphatase family protein [Planctomycetota bacterium]
MEPRESTSPRAAPALHAACAAALAAALFSTAAAAQEAAAAEAAIVLDGRLDDVSVDEEFTLQGGLHTSRLLLDLDGKPATGRREQAGDLGTDLEIVFSPPSPEPGKPARAGVEVRALDDHGIYQVVSHAAVGLLFAPAFSAPQYELRIDRQTSLPEPSGSRWRRSAAVRGRFEVLGAQAEVLQRGEFSAADIPPLDERELAPRGLLPERQEGVLRLVSWNVENARPRENPEPFGRILRALDPDAVLLQEWWETSAEELEAWFTKRVPSHTPWRALTFGDLGVAVLSRYPAAPLAAERLMPAREVAGKKARAVRCAGALVEAPCVKLVVCSVHLKARGAAHTWEDELRQVEAQAINRSLRSALEAASGAACVVGGDMNLVGSSLPLLELQRGLDADGSELDLVDAFLLGERANYTWAQDSAPFTPGRLDYVLLSGSLVEVAQSFVLDTALLSGQALEFAHLLREDSLASDHRPLVFEVRPRPRQE